MEVTLLTAVGSTWEGGLVATLSSAERAHLVRRCADLPDLLAAAAAGLARVAVVSADLRGLDRSVLAELHGAGVTVLGVYAPGDEQQETFLRRLGLTRVLPADARPDRWAEELAAVAQETADLHPGADAPVPGRPAEPPEPQRSAQGEVLAVWGPAGAPGRTFVATQLAGVLAEAGRKVLLVDADTYGACIAQVLALLDEAAGLAAAVRAGNLGRLDLVMLAGLAPEARPGLRVLTGLPQPERWPELPPESVTHTLAIARELAEIVVVDCGFCLEEDEELSYDTRAPRRNGVTTAVLADAEHVLAVGRADPVGLQRLVRGLSDLRDLGIQPQVVANRVRAAAVGPGPAGRVTDALMRFAGVAEVACLPDDADAVDAAVLEGRLLAETDPRSELLQAVRDLAESLPLRHGLVARSQRRRRRAKR